MMTKDWPFSIRLSYCRAMIREPGGLEHTVREVAEASGINYHVVARERDAYLTELVEANMPHRPDIVLTKEITVKGVRQVKEFHLPAHKAARIDIMAHCLGCSVPAISLAVRVARDWINVYLRQSNESELIDRIDQHGTTLGIVSHVNPELVSA